MLACAAVGAVSSSVFAEEQGHQLLLLSGALVAGQAVGHVALVAASDAGFHCPAAFSPQMLLAHGLAAPVCALLISLVEHLYVVCASTLCWLRLNFVNEYRPAVVVLRWPTKSVVVQRLVFAPGGTRAPPQPACA